MIQRGHPSTDHCSRKAPKPSNIFQTTRSGDLLLRQPRIIADTSALNTAFERCRMRTGNPSSGARRLCEVCLHCGWFQLKYHAVFFSEVVSIDVYFVVNFGARLHTGMRLFIPLSSTSTASLRPSRWALLNTTPPAGVVHSICT